MQKIFYLCDGEKEDCKKRSCYKNGGECKHTTYIYNARNFQQRNPNVDESSFYEKETASENKTQSTSELSERQEI